MKNDTSKIIDLDELLKSSLKSTNSSNTSGILSESTAFSDNKISEKINIDAILTEWAWRCDSGYPIVENGTFLKHEVEILENVLASLYPNVHFDTSVLLEARPHEHLDWKYIPMDNEAGLRAWNSIGIDNFSEFRQNPLFNTTPNSISVEDTTYFISSEKITIIDSETASNLINDGSVTVWQTEAIPNTYFLIKKVKTKLVSQLKGVSATDTDVKEGLTAVFFESKITEPFDKNNFLDQLNILQSEVDSASGLDSTALRRINKYISTVKDSVPTAAVLSTLNETLSKGLAMRKAYGKEFTLNRSELFKKIRDTASKITGMPADKWCPGDVYLIRNNSDPIIDVAISNALESKNIADLNVLFLNTWGERKNDAGACIVGCSLKMAKAQAGKAKAYLKQFSKSDFDYNVTKEDQALAKTGIIEGIIRLRKKLSSILRNNDICEFKYSSTTDATALEKLPEKMLREKYAALKIIAFLLGNEFEDVDDNLLGAIAYGMSLSNTNPSFFKIVGNPTGRTASIQAFKAGDTLKFYSTDPTKLSTVEVIDSDTANAVQFKCQMQMADEILDVIFQSRSNGYTQATLELLKVKPVREV